MTSGPGRAAAALSLLGTPFLLLVSTSADVYLRNQVEFDLQVTLLLPYLLAGGAGTLLGAGLWALASRPALRAPLWAFYLAGPLFLAWALARHTAFWFVAEPPGLAALALGWLAGAIALGRRSDPRLAAPLFAALAVAWIAADGWGFAQRRIRFEPPPALAEGAPAADAPSVHHLLFDEFDSALFARTLTPEVERALGGFTWYRAATSTSGKTHDSVPAVFAGRVVRSGEDHAWAALNTEQSFVYGLRQAGYATHGYLPRLWKFEQRLFDRARYHSPVAGARHDRLFLRTWLLAYAPEALWGLLPAATAMERAELRAGRHLPATAPLASLAALDAAAEDEPRRAPRGQYVFAHLLIPHTPYVLRRDCTVPEGTVLEHAGDGDPVEHSRCATARVVAWAELLERLGRFESSLIVVHADHGSHLDWSSGEPVWIPPLQRKGAPLNVTLLVKPPGATRDQPFAVSDAPASLLDVAPTILRAAGTRPGPDLAGRPLLTSR